MNVEKSLFRTEVLPSLNDFAVNCGFIFVVNAVTGIQPSDVMRRTPSTNGTV